MSVFIFWVLIVSLSWLIGWIQGHGTGVLEGRALRELQQAWERPMRKVKL